MSSLDQTLARFPLPTWQPFAGTIILLVMAFFIWAWQAELDEVVTAPGTVVPQGQVRVVQHLEGGMITEILVREGQRVEPGQALVQLDLGTIGLNRAEIQARLDGMRLERARLMAEVAGIDLNLPEREAGRQPDLAQAEQTAYVNRRREFESNLAVLGEQRNQRKLDITALSTRLATLRNSLVLAREQLEIGAKLGASNLYPRVEVLRLERDVEQIEGEIASLEVARPTAEGALKEAREKERQEIRRFRSKASERLRDVESEIARMDEQLARAASQKLRTEVVSPIAGIVKNLQLNTIGGVVDPGQPIVEIVPVDEILVVEAMVSPIDVGQISEGQPALVKISTYDYLRYGGLEGRISHIAADSSVDREGNHYFEVIIATESMRLESGGESFPVSPGMEAEVDLQIGTRSVIDYLIQPVLKLRSEAFRER